MGEYLIFLAFRTSPVIVKEGKCVLEEGCAAGNVRELWKQGLKEGRYGLSGTGCTEILQCFLLDAGYCYIGIKAKLKAKGSKVFGIN